ncbi:TolC family protein [Roseateles amylovorans]|uniref:TolC family protein n=1 Tax=Roseateles amylovorans TaxID=2978473 RepID=A0ABY6AWW4_9BURK|nr:TolC family protein [Roseateles amylovorans]UXH77393.1 TolC family protein [Roseateles amylovorans]
MHRSLVPLAMAALLCTPAFGQSDVPATPALPGATPSTSPATDAATPAPTAPTAPAAATADPHHSPRQAVAAPLTLQAAIQTALSHNPSLRAAGYEVEAGEGAVRQAGAMPNPILGIEQEDTRRESRTSTVMLSQTFELGGKRAARMALAQRGRDLSALTLQARRAALRSATIQAYFEALIASERVRMAEASLGLASSGTEAVARRVTAGKVSPTEETRARVAESTARIELQQAQVARRAAFRTLALVMGVSPDSVAALDGSADAIPLPPDEQVLADRIDHSPAVRLARMEVERAGAAFDLERARGVPDVTVGLGGKREAGAGRTAPMISVSIPIPLLDRNQGAQREALRRRDAAQAMAEAEAMRVRAEALHAADELQARGEEITALRRDVLPGAQAAYDAARRGFELGKFGFLDVLDAQRTLLQARGQFFTALSQAHRLSAELDRLLGADNDRP